MRVVEYGLEQNLEGHPCLVGEKEVDFNSKDWTLNEIGIAKLLCEGFRLTYKAEEFVYVVAFSQSGRILGVFQLSHGVVSSALVGKREIMIRLLLVGASCFAIAHNHPGGNVKPSIKDMDMYTSVKAAGELMDIPLLDSIIVGRDAEDCTRCYSIAREKTHKIVFS